MTTTQMLKELTDAHSSKHCDYQNEYSDVLKDGELEDADAWGFTVQGTNGRTEVTFPVGLSSKVYKDYSPLLDDYGKAVLAWGVLKNMLRPLPWSEWNTASTLMCQTYGNDESQWLPHIIEKQGFDAVAAEMTTRLATYRRTTPPARIRLAVFTRPVWNGVERVLVYGDQEWVIAKQAKNVIALLDALEKSDWCPVVVNLEFEQVSQATYTINQRTRPHITFRAATDCMVTWASSVK